MPGEMLATGRHPGVMQAVDEGARQLRDLRRIVGKGPRGNHRITTVIDVQHRRETQVQTTGQHLGRHQPGTFTRQ